MVEVKLTKAPRKKIRINAKSIWLLDEIDKHVRYCNIRGPLDRFRDIAADPLDGLALKSELSDLIRRRLLTVIDYGFDDSLGRDPSRARDPDLCGTSWSVNPTERLIVALWSDRIQPETIPRKRRAALASSGKDE